MLALSTTKHLNGKMKMRTDTCLNPKDFTKKKKMYLLKWWLSNNPIPEKFQDKNSSPFRRQIVSNSYEILGRFDLIVTCGHLTGYEIYKRP